MNKFTYEGSYSLDFKGSIPFRRDIQRILMAFDMEAYQHAFKTCFFSNWRFLKNGFMLKSN
jgi:hypothetical protein